MKLILKKNWQCDSASVELVAKGEIGLPAIKMWRFNPIEQESLVVFFNLQIPDEDTSGIELKCKCGVLPFVASIYFVTTGDTTELWYGLPAISVAPPKEVKMEERHGQVRPGEFPVQDSTYGFLSVTPLTHLALGDSVPVRLSFEMSNRWLDSFSITLNGNVQTKSRLPTSFGVVIPATNKWDTTIIVVLKPDGHARAQVNARYGAANQRTEFLFLKRGDKIEWLDASNSDWRGIYTWDTGFLSSEEIAQNVFSDSINAARPEDEFDATIYVRDSIQLHQVQTMVGSTIPAAKKDNRLAFKCRTSKANLLELRKRGVGVSFVPPDL